MLTDDAHEAIRSFAKNKTVTKKYHLVEKMENTIRKVEKFS